jgi:hypothetical protein
MPQGRRPMRHARGSIDGHRGRGQLGLQAPLDKLPRLHVDQVTPSQAWLEQTTKMSDRCRSVGKGTDDVEQVAKHRTCGGNRVALEAYGGGPAGNVSVIYHPHFCSIQASQRMG